MTLSEVESNCIDKQKILPTTEPDSKQENIPEIEVDLQCIQEKQPYTCTRDDKVQCVLCTLLSPFWIPLGIVLLIVAFVMGVVASLIILVFLIACCCCIIVALSDDDNPTSERNINNCGRH